MRDSVDPMWQSGHSLSGFFREWLDEVTPNGMTWFCAGEDERDVIFLAHGAACLTFKIEMGERPLFRALIYGDEEVAGSGPNPLPSPPLRWLIDEADDRGLLPEGVGE